MPISQVVEFEFTDYQCKCFKHQNNKVFDFIRVYIAGSIFNISKFFTFFRDFLESKRLFWTGCRVSSGSCAFTKALISLNVSKVVFFVLMVGFKKLLSRRGTLGKSPEPFLAPYPIHFNQNQTQCMASCFVVCHFDGHVSLPTCQLWAFLEKVCLVMRW